MIEWDLAWLFSLNAALGGFLDLMVCVRFCPVVCNKGPPRCAEGCMPLDGNTKSSFFLLLNRTCNLLGKIFMLLIIISIIIVNL